MLCDKVYDCVYLHFFFFQAEDGIRDLVRSRGLGDVYKRQVLADRTLGGITDIAADLAIADLFPHLLDRIAETRYFLWFPPQQVKG